MSYLTVISLAEAKLHLRIDDDSFDAEITRMIKSALSYVERYTDIWVYARDKDYYIADQLCRSVYEYPINSVVLPALAEDYKVERKSGYSVYSLNTGNDLTLNIGYTDPAEVPTDLIDAALQIIDVWFYGGEKKVNFELIPPSVKGVLDLHKRFII